MAKVATNPNGTTGVGNEKVVPNEFNLLQNYPNPFNPTTTISFSIAKNGLVNLSVFSVTGEKVATLVNQEYQIGNYIVQFNADNLPSGIYFYRLTTGNFVSTKKMILMK